MRARCQGSHAEKSRTREADDMIGHIGGGCKTHRSRISQEFLLHRTGPELEHTLVSSIVFSCLHVCHRPLLDTPY